MIYLDNAATSFPKPECVYAAMDKFARNSLANPGRSGHKMALAAEHAIDDARHRLNRFLHGDGPDRVIFTHNGTDSLNIAIKGIVKSGDHVITSDLEHNSVSRPLTALAEAGVITLTRVAADAGGTLRPLDIAGAMRPNTTLVALTHASNVLGTLQPVAEIGSLVRAAGALFLVDAAQTVGVVPIDIRAMGIDLLAFPGHKGLFGPTGTGVLCVGPRANVRPWREGGTGGDSTTPTQPAMLPYSLEGGTPNVLGIVGMIAGLDFVERETPEKLRAHEVELCERLRRALVGFGFEFLGHDDTTRRVGALSLRHDILAAPELGSLLDSAFDIAVRPGLHCAPGAHRAGGSFPEGTVRVSPGPFTTEGEIDSLAAALLEVVGA